MTTGTSSVTLTVTSDSGSNSAVLVISILPPPGITSILTDFASTTTAFAYQIAASGSPASFNATGLPAGLSINPATGVISGTPTVTGTFAVSISASNVAGTDTQTLTLVITGTALPLSQAYVEIHYFDDGTVNNEGTFPVALVAGPSSTLYGVTLQGGIQRRWHDLQRGRIGAGERRGRIWQRAGIEPARPGAGCCRQFLRHDAEWRLDGQGYDFQGDARGSGDASAHVRRWHDDQRRRVSTGGADSGCRWQFLWHDREWRRADHGRHRRQGHDFPDDARRGGHHRA